MYKIKHIYDHGLPILYNHLILVKLIEFDLIITLNNYMKQIEIVFITISL